LPKELISVPTCSNDKSIFEEATQRVVQNILKSYTGYVDIFSEIIQNSLDACDKKVKAAGPGYSPRLWIKIDIVNRIVRIVDNGSGMSLDEVKFCFRPNVSFKGRKEARGHKGVGATFLAYGFGLIRLFTKQKSSTFAVKLAGGRQWADDLTGSYSRPKLEADDFEISELANETSGTAIEISIPQSVRPELGWWGASTAHQWYQLLRMRTPLGGIYLAGATPPKVKVHIAVNDYRALRKIAAFLNLCESDCHNKIRGCGYDGSIRFF
jgi:Histidine kinase-, DNA gyrase B-, and HSP90-like ATPase